MLWEKVPVAASGRGRGRGHDAQFTRVAAHLIFQHAASPERARVSSVVAVCLVRLVVPEYRHLHGQVPRVMPGHRSLQRAKRLHPSPAGPVLGRQVRIDAVEHGALPSLSATVVHQRKHCAAAQNEEQGCPS